jgi:uncharacterized protein YbcV (DUF1398 family)
MTVSFDHQFQVISDPLSSSQKKEGDPSLNPEKNYGQDDPLLPAFFRTIKQYGRLILIVSCVSMVLGLFDFMTRDREYLSEMTFTASDYAMISSLGSDLDLGDLNFSNQVAPLSIFLSLLRSEELAQRLVQTPEFQEFLKKTAEGGVLSWGDDQSDAGRIRDFLARYVSTTFDFSHTLYTLRLVTDDPVQSQSLLKVVFQETDKIVRKSYLNTLIKNIENIEQALKSSQDVTLKMHLRRQLSTLEQRKITFSAETPIASLVTTEPNFPMQPITPRLLSCLIVPWMWGMFGMIAWIRIRRRRFL